MLRQKGNRIMANEVKIVWAAEDIQFLRPSWTLKKCENWLQNNAKHIVDPSIEFGWETIKDLLSWEDEDEEI